MIPTLEDVGKYCGVSRTTVSRVINNSPLVNRETRERVLKAVEETRYAPNLIARSLTRNRTETLAVALPDITGGVFPEILAGLDDVAGECGYHLLVVFVGGNRSRPSTVEDLFRHRRVDGVVVVASMGEGDQLAILSEWKVPIVCVAQKPPLPQIPSVLFDDQGGAFKATRLLLDRGCHRLLHIRGPAKSYDARERRKGFRMALETAGLKPDPEMEVPGNFKRDGGFSAVKKALAQGIRFDGIFAANDETAIGAIEALVEEGVSVPEQVSLVGFDDIESSRFIGLSTVRVPLREMGRAAAEMAMKLIDGEKPVSEILPTELIERASSSPAGHMRVLKIKQKTKSKKR